MISSTISSDLEIGTRFFPLRLISLRFQATHFHGREKEISLIMYQTNLLYKTLVFSSHEKGPSESSVSENRWKVNYAEELSRYYELSLHLYGQRTPHSTLSVTACIDWVVLYRCIRFSPRFRTCKIRASNTVDWSVTIFLLFRSLLNPKRQPAVWQ